MDFVTILFAVLVIFFTFIYTYFKWNYTYWKSKGLLYIPPRIPFGSRIHQPSKRLCSGLRIKAWYDYLKSRGVRHGGVYLFASPMYLPVDPEIIKVVISKDFNYFTDRGVFNNARKDPLSAHLISMDGTQWKKWRSKLTPTFSTGKMKMMFPTLVECSESLEEAVVRACQASEAIDIKELAGCFTTDVIGSCAFGLDCRSFKDKDAPFRKYGKLIFTFSKAQSIKRMLSFAFPNLAKAMGFRIIKKEVSEFFVNVVKDTVAYREANNICRRDFLQLLINIRNGVGMEDFNQHAEEAKKMTIEQMAAQAFAFFAAGFETSSTTMAFCLYELSLNQDIQDKVRNEVKDVLKRYNGEITYDGVQEMKYTEQVLEETLRKYPAIPTLNRQCTQDYKVPETDFVIEKDIKVLISIMGLHNDPEFFPNPEKFDPDRFSSINKHSIRPYTYLPFGDGPRNCIGLRFGMTQGKVGLAVLLKNHKFSLNARTKTPLEFEPKNFVLTPVGGIWLDVEAINA